jgi:NAD+ synthase (glutamine-hydrolysing)
MKICLAQLNFHVGNFDLNIKKIIAAIDKAEQQEADLLVCSELSVCGYPARDFLAYPHFISQCIKAVETIALQTKKVAVLMGAPSYNSLPGGKDLYNSAYFLYDGKIQQVFNKTLLPTYDVFDEYRYFEPNQSFQLLEFKGAKIAVTICEDIWDAGTENPLYITSPLDELISLKPDFIVNLSASPFSYTQFEARVKMLKANLMRYQLPIVYVNQVGAQTELIFDGGSLALDKNGGVIKQLRFFKEEISTVEINTSSTTIITSDTSEEKHIADIYSALVLGVRDYFAKLGFTKAVLGLSGGIDSALVACIATEALGKENVLNVLLPSGYSSQHSLDDAIQLAKNLGTKYEIVPIEPVYQSFLNVLEPHFKALPFSIAEENLQARCRGVILMGFSNKFGYILLNTTNKSEAAVGYGTLYGDMCGGLSVLGDVYKTQVFALAKYINRSTEIIPLNTINKPPSAELRPDQKDSDSLPDYNILDEVLHGYIEELKSPDALVQEGFDEALVKRVLKMVNMNEWKRFQAAPILRVSPKAFGMGRRMPIEGRYLS